MSRNRIANIAFAVCSLGELVVLAIIQGMLISLKSDSSTEANTRALSIATAFTCVAARRQHRVPLLTDPQRRCVAPRRSSVVHPREETSRPQPVSDMLPRS